MRHERDDQGGVSEDGDLRGAGAEGGRDGDRDAQDQAPRADGPAARFGPAERRLREVARLIRGPEPRVRPGDGRPDHLDRDGGRRRRGWLRRHAAGRARSGGDRGGRRGHRLRDGSCGCRCRGNGCGDGSEGIDLIFMIYCLLFMVFVLFENCLLKQTV